jgi:hypothetical protein
MAKAPKPKTSKVGSILETTIVFSPKSTVVELAEARRNTKKRVQSQNGTLGNAIAKAVEEKHLNRKAFGIACQLDALDDETLHVVYFNLLHYLDALDVTKRATAQEEMFEAGDMSEPAGTFSDAGDEDEAPVRGKKKNAKANGNGHANGKPPKAAASRKKNPGITGAELAAHDAREVEETAGTGKPH